MNLECLVFTGIVWFFSFFSLMMGACGAIACEGLNPEKEFWTYLVATRMNVMLFAIGLGFYVMGLAALPHPTGTNDPAFWVAGFSASFGGLVALCIMFREMIAPSTEEVKNR